MSLDCGLAGGADVMVVCEGKPELVWHISRRPSLETVASGLDAAQSAVAVKAVERVVGLLERNVNPRLAVEELMLAMPHPIPPDGVGPALIWGCNRYGHRGMGRGRRAAITSWAGADSPRMPPRTTEG